MYDLNKETIARIESLAAKEHRTFEGQLLAMSDLYERTYKIKSDQLKKPISRPPQSPLKETKEKPRAKRGWPKGKPRSEETRRKIAEARRGKKASPETRQKISESLKQSELFAEAMSKQRKPWSNVSREKLSYAMRLSHAKRRLAKLAQARNSEQ